MVHSSLWANTKVTGRSQMHNSVEYIFRNTHVHVHVHDMIGEDIKMMTALSLYGCASIITVTGSSAVIQQYYI